MEIEFSNETVAALAEAGFEPCFVRELQDGDQIAILHESNPHGPTEMTVTRIHRTGLAIRTETEPAFWIGVLTDGRKVHCTFKQQHPAWMQPRPVTDDEPTAPIWFEAV